MNNPEDKIELENIYQLGELVSSLINNSEAWKDTATRLSDAHDYVKENCMPEGWGKNVWHTILNDAIKLRKVLEATKNARKI